MGKGPISGRPREAPPLRLKVLTLRFSPALGAFDDTPIQEFARDKDLLHVRDHFFVVSEVPHPACVTTWKLVLLSIG